MKTMIKNLGGLFVFALLGACAADYDFDSTAKLSLTASPFHRGLQKEYVALAKAEAAEGDWLDAVYFHDKAKKAAVGDSVAPTSFDERKEPAEALAGLTDARARLMAALGAGAANNKPEAAARAQAGFDCWMQEQEENFQPDDIAACKKMFDGAMAELAVRPTAMPAPPPAPAPLPGPFVVYFDFNKAAITADGQRVIASAAQAFKARGAKRMAVVGNADTSGNSRSNLALSKRRADAVVKALVAAGVSAGAVTSFQFGEDRPAVNTPDNTKEPKNRRVEIALTN